MEEIISNYFENMLRNKSCSKTRIRQCVAHVVNLIDMARDLCDDPEFIKSIAFEESCDVVLHRLYDKAVSKHPGCKLIDYSVTQSVAETVNSMRIPDGYLYIQVPEEIAFMYVYMTEILSRTVDSKCALLLIDKEMYMFIKGLVDEVTVDKLIFWPFDIDINPLLDITYLDDQATDLHDTHIRIELPSIERFVHDYNAYNFSDVYKYYNYAYVDNLLEAIITITKSFIDKFSEKPTERFITKYREFKDFKTKIGATNEDYTDGLRNRLVEDYEDISNNVYQDTTDRLITYSFIINGESVNIKDFGLEAVADALHEFKTVLTPEGIHFNDISNNIVAVYRSEDIPNNANVASASLPESDDISFVRTSEFGAGVVSGTINGPTFENIMADAVRGITGVYNGVITNASTDADEQTTVRQGRPRLTWVGDRLVVVRD